MNKEVVVDNDATAVDQDNAQTDDNDLNSLLDQYGKEFDEETKTPESNSNDSDVVKRLEALERERTEADIGSASNIVKESLGDMPINVPDALVRGYLGELAAKDDRFYKAFQDRKVNPKKFETILKEAGKQLKKDLSPVDQQTTDDRNAVVESIRGSKQPTEDETPNFNSMNDYEFTKWKTGIR